MVIVHKVWGKGTVVKAGGKVYRSGYGMKKSGGGSRSSAVQEAESPLYTPKGGPGTQVTRENVVWQYTKQGTWKSVASTRGITRAAPTPKAPAPRAVPIPTGPKIERLTPTPAEREIGASIIGRGVVPTYAKPTPEERFFGTSLIGRGKPAGAEAALRTKMRLAEAKRIVGEAPLPQRAALYGSTLLSPSGYELIGGAFTGKTEEIVARKLESEIRRKEKPMNILGVPFSPRAAVEALDSPPVAIESLFLYPGGAAVVGKAITGTRVGRGLFQAGKRVITPKVGKVIQYGALAGFTGLQVAEAERLRQAGRTEEAIGRGVTIPAELLAFGSGIRFGKKIFFQTELEKGIKKSPKFYKEQARAGLSEVRTLEKRGVKVPVKEVTLKDVTSVPKSIRKEANRFIVDKKDEIVVGGSLTLQAQGVKFKPGRLAVSDADLYSKPHILGIIKKGEAAKRKQLAKEAAERFKKVLSPSQAKNVHIKSGTMVKYGPYKVMEIGSSAKYIANVEAVQPAYTLVKQTWRKTPKGVSIMKLEVGAKRKAASLTDPKRRIVGKALEKDLPDLQLSIRALRKYAGVKPPKLFVFKGKPLTKKLKKDVILGTPTSKSLISGKRGKLELHHIDYKKRKGVVLTRREHERVHAIEKGIISGKGTGFYQLLKTGRLSTTRKQILRGLKEPKLLISPIPKKEKPKSELMQSIMGRPTPPRKERFPPTKKAPLTYEYPKRKPPKAPPYLKPPKPYRFPGAPKAPPYKPPRPSQAPPYKPVKPPTPYAPLRPPRQPPYTPPYKPPRQPPYIPLRPPRQPPYTPKRPPPPLTPLTPLPVLGERRIAKVKKPKRKIPKIGPIYKPSLLAVIGGITAKKAPKRVTGLGIRPIIRNSKRRRLI